MSKTCFKQQCDETPMTGCLQTPRFTRMCFDANTACLLMKSQGR
jgi:hypothetical protein